MKEPVRFLFASSMHVYGNQTNEVNENTGPEPLSYYAFTKYLSEELIRKAAQENAHTQFAIARLYSCFGPAQGEGYVAADLVKKILALKGGTDNLLKTGPLKTFRRFVDVRDAVQCLHTLMNWKHPSNFEIYNLVSPH